MISAYEHGRHATQHAKHIQACPFDTGTPNGANGAKDFATRSVKSSRADREVIHAEHY